MNKMHGVVHESSENAIPLHNLSRKDTRSILHLDELDSDSSEGSILHGTTKKDRHNLRSRWRGKRTADQFKARRRKEEPKIPLSRNLARAFGHFLLFHAVPIGVALALIILNTKTHFYGTSGKWLGALQFTAKVHEILMQVSIITAMTAYLQRLLVHQRPVPFGAIFSAYQVTQMSYLWSSEFRAAVTTPGFDGMRKAGFVLFVPLSILMAAIVGPSSAIAMQPRAINFTLPESTFALNITSNALYPNSFDEPGPPLVFNNDPGRCPLTYSQSFIDLHHSE